MHLRRALLLFAIVLGLAALAAAVSRPTDVDDEPATTPQAGAPAPAPTASDGSAGLSPTVVTFDVAKPRSHKLVTDRAATVMVDVESPGMVTIPDLGLSTNADPLTPARFDVLVRDVGEYHIDFVPPSSEESQSAGTLVVEAPGT